jgi:hypothetical protein
MAEPLRPRGFGRWSGHHNRLNEPFPCGDPHSTSPLASGRRFQRNRVYQQKFRRLCARIAAENSSPPDAMQRPAAPSCRVMPLAGTALCSVEERTAILRKRKAPGLNQGALIEELPNSGTNPILTEWFANCDRLLRNH